MKRVTIIFAFIAIYNTSFSQAQSLTIHKGDSSVESVQTAISEIFYKAIKGGLSKVSAGSPQYNTYFIMQFRIAGYDSVKDFATSSHDSKMNSIIAKELDKSLQAIKNLNLDYTVFEGIDISIPVAIVDMTKKDSAINLAMPIKNLYLMPYIFVDRHNKMIKNNARIIKCYQLLPVVWPEMQTGWERPKFVPAKKKSNT